MSFDAQQFRKQRIYEATSPVPQVLKDLQYIAGLDRYARQQRQKLKPIQGWCFAGLTLSGLLIMFSGMVGVLPLVLLAGTAFVTSAVGVVIVSMRIESWKNLDLPNLRYNLPQEILTLVERDMDAKTAVAIALDFENSRVKCIASTDHPYRSGWTRESLAHPWMTMNGTFLDGTDFELGLTQLYSRSYGYKTSQSGKRKYKSKTKIKGLLLSLELNFSRKRYGAVSVLKDKIIDAVQLPDNAQVKSLRVSDRKLLLQVKLSPDALMLLTTGTIYPAVASMFLSLYHVLNLAQKLSKSR